MAIAVALPDESAAATRLEALGYQLARAVDARAYYEPSHSEAVALLCAAMGPELQMTAPRVRRLRLAARLHDVGKIGVPDAILLKKGGLTPFEFESMKRHPRIGSDIVEAAGLDEESLWVLHHHERPDGTGYPHGLAGASIPIESRAIAVADAFDVMTSDRTYQAAKPVDEALAILEENRGAQFDADCVAALRAVVLVP